MAEMQQLEQFEQEEALMQEMHKEMDTLRSLNSTGSSHTTSACSSTASNSTQRLLQEIRQEMKQEMEIELIESMLSGSQGQDQENTQAAMIQLLQQSQMMQFSNELNSAQKPQSQLQGIFE